MPGARFWGMGWSLTRQVRSHGYLPYQAHPHSQDSLHTAESVHGRRGVCPAKQRAADQEHSIDVVVMQMHLMRI
jgi:hypothetical protein